MLIDPQLPELTFLHRGKVRDSFRIDEARRLIVVTDRISAFDLKIKTPIARKGEVLNQLAAFWFNRLGQELGVAHHLLAVVDAQAMLVRECEPIRVEMVVRGAVTGSMWRGYQEGKRTFSGKVVPDALTENQILATPIVTPTTKEASDREVSPEEIFTLGLVDEHTYREMEDVALRVFRWGRDVARACGLILADTKYEFGFAEVNGVRTLVLIDEVHTADSSRFWDAETYARDPRAVVSFDKEFLRQWMLAHRRGDVLPTELPGDIADETSRRYLTLFERLTGAALADQRARHAGDPLRRLRRGLANAGLLPRASGTAVSPLDGRYAKGAAPLVEWFSEYALMRERVRVEVLHAHSDAVSSVFGAPSPAAMTRAARLLVTFTPADYAAIKRHEDVLRHDVKAVEVFVRSALYHETDDNPNRVHFALTSEDVNNLAYSLCVRDYIEDVQLPLLRAVLEKLCALAASWRSAPFPARTHGQHATPTTFGKELAVYVGRLVRCLERLRSHRLRGKLNGATGNYSAAQVAAPEVDWRAYERRFVEALGLEVNAATTQIEDHGSLAEYFDLVRACNNAVLDLCRDVWMYISYGYLVQRSVAHEVGSSTMPHKVNPIRFENAEGNLELSSALLAFLSDKLSRSRMQRDLSESTVMRNIGVALGHHHLALNELISGLDLIDLDEARCRHELEEHPELLSEAVQSVLRVERRDDVYAELKRATRGKTFAREDLAAFVRAMPPPSAAKLEGLTPSQYLGDAVRVCDEVVASAREVLTRSAEAAP